MHCAMISQSVSIRRPASDQSKPVSLDSPADKSLTHLTLNEEPNEQIQAVMGFKNCQQL